MDVSEGDDDSLADLDPAALARAEAALNALADSYLSWAAADMEKLHAVLAALHAAPADPALRAQLYAVAHDIKGQAATFGYPLLTLLGERLCRTVKAKRAPEDMALLVQSMAEVLEHRLTGDGGERGCALLARLVG